MPTEHALLVQKPSLSRRWLWTVACALSVAAIGMGEASRIRRGDQGDVVLKLTLPVHFGTCGLTTFVGSVSADCLTSPDDRCAGPKYRLVSPAVGPKIDLDIVIGGRLPNENPALPGVSLRHAFGATGNVVSVSGELVQAWPCPSRRSGSCIASPRSFVRNSWQALSSSVQSSKATVDATGLTDLSMAWNGASGGISMNLVPDLKTLMDLKVVPPDLRRRPRP